MNLNEQFDELARQKLEERAFPFQEEAWLEAQQALRGNRSRRIGGAWFWGSIAAVGIAAWLLWPADQAPQRTQTAQVSEASVESDAREPGADERPDAVKPTAVARTEPASGDYSAVEVTAAVESTRVEPGENEAPRTTGTQPAREKATSAHAEGNPLADAPNVAAISSDATASFAGSVSEHELNTPGSHPEMSDSGTAEPVTMHAAAAVDAPMESDPDPAIVLSSTVDEHPSDSTFAGHGADAAEASVVDAAPSLASTATDEDKPTNFTDTAGTKTARDTTFVQVTPSDSALQAPPIPPAAAPLVSPQSPWELSVLGGAFQTTSTYNGQGTADWQVAAQQTYGFGAELMHLGNNFGMGFGLHYGSYADRLSTPELSSSTTALQRYWYLANVDTTILFVTGYDTVAMAYTGINVPTTIQVLQSAYDTVTTRSLLRAASERVNRTSYVELPLLFDAHLVQGRWSIGLRGGPSLGLLTTRSGSIPRDMDEGSVSLNEVTMRRFMLGWTARAYVRYRFNSAWSVGLEPTMRGQLLDGLDDHGTTRRSSAIGGMLSLSYRLR